MAFEWVVIRSVWAALFVLYGLLTLTEVIMADWAIARRHATIAGVSGVLTLAAWVAVRT